MTDSAPQTPVASDNRPPVRVRYEHTAAVHTTQFLVAVREEGIVLDCSSGTVLEHGAPSPVMPVHTRLAIPSQVVPRLVQLLTHATQQLGKLKNSAVADGPKPPQQGEGVSPGPGARLPKLKGSNV